MRSDPNLTHEVVLNLGGKAIMSARTDKETAERVAKSFGMPFPGVHWPLKIGEIGSKGAVEQNALADAVAQKMAVGEGEIIMVVVGKRMPPLDMEDPNEWDEAHILATQLEYKTREMLQTINGGEIEWNTTVGLPGTLFTRPPKADEPPTK